VVEWHSLKIPNAQNLESSKSRHTQNPANLKINFEFDETINESGFKKGVSLIFLQFMTGKNIDEKECFGKKSMKIFDLEKRFCNL
jgi:hypothetical protein